MNICANWAAKNKTIIRGTVMLTIFSHPEERSPRRGKATKDLQIKKQEDPSLRSG